MNYSEHTNGLPTDFINRQKWVIVLFLAFVPVAVYLPSLHFDFVYDDAAVLTSNSFVQKGTDGIYEIWTTSYFKGYSENMDARAFRPLPLTTLAIQREFSGNNPMPYHAFNLLLYALTAIVLYCLLSEIFRDRSQIIPILTAILFLLHPIHVEVVANIKSRDTLLGFLNFATAAFFLLKHADSRKIFYLILSVAFYLLGLFSKEELISLVAVFPLLLYFFRNQTIKAAISGTLSFWGALVLFLIIRSVVLGGINEGVTLTALDNSLLASNGIGQRTASTILALGHYLLKTLIPHPLICDYSFSTIPLVNWNDWRVYVSATVHLSLTGLAVFGFRKRKPYSFAILFYYISVFIFSSIVTPNVSVYNDRFLYIPVLGTCLLVAIFIEELTINRFAGWTTIGVKPGMLLMLIVSLISILAIYKISKEMPDWKNELTLFANDSRYAPYNARLRKNYGGALTRLAVKNQESNPQLSFSLAQKAIGELETALALNHEIPTGHVYLGICKMLVKDLEGAKFALKSALKLKPGYYSALTNLANVYYRNGEYGKAAETIMMIPEQTRKEADRYLLSISKRMHGEAVTSQAKAER